MRNDHGGMGMFRRLAGLLGDRRGNVAVLTALLLPVSLGTAGIATEAASWQANHRAMQNAADSAAIAAASNSAANYLQEARAVAAQYGFAQGVNGVSVTASNAAVCPAGGATCYSVTVSRPYPLLLAQLVGFRGDTTVNGAPAQTVTATSVAALTTKPRPYCMLALGAGGTGVSFLANGVPNANLSGCNVMSNTSATCNGHNLGADIGDAHLTNNGCGVVEHSNIPAVTDPYASRAVNIPPDTTCGSRSPRYPQIPTSKAGAALPASNLLSGVQDWTGGAPVMCGDVQLTGPVTINTTAAGATLVIYNGQLDTHGYSLTTSSGSALTIVFARGATYAGPYTHAPTGGGTLDIAAPTTGPWAGMAIYQDPSLTSGVDITAAGSSPTWNITGMVYLPHAQVTFSGAVNKSSNGKSCFGIVADGIRINGTGSIFAHGECAQAGLTLPASQVPNRGALVS